MGISGHFLDYLKTLKIALTLTPLRLLKRRPYWIFIKPISLLPKMEISEEERQSIEELERRLEIYKFIRNVSGVIKNIYGKNPSFERESFANMDIVFGIKLANLFLKTF